MSARYRVKVWFKDNPKIEIKRTFRSDCRLCAASKAMVFAEQIAGKRKIHVSRIGWTCELLKGAPGQWEIDSHDRMPMLWAVKSHGHG